MKMKCLHILQVFVIVLQVCKVRGIWEAFHALEQAKTSTTTKGKIITIIIGTWKPLNVITDNVIIWLMLSN
jgi:hypothetical protein